MRGLLFLVSFLALLVGEGRGESVVPFRMEGGLLLIEVKLDGSQQPLSFALDTGAEESLIDRGVARKRGLQLISGERVQTPSGILRVSRCETVSINAGGRMLLAKRLLAMDLSRQSKVVGRQLDGLIGLDALAGRPFRIDFKNSLIELSAASSNLAEVMRLARHQGGLCVEMNVGGEPLARVRVDTGCVRGLCWSPSSWKNISRPWRHSGVARALPVALGGLDLGIVETHLYRDPLLPREQGLLGNALLSRFDSIWIDVPRGRLALEGDLK